MSHAIQLILQLVIAVGIANVWLLRSGRSTAFRGGEATNMKEEFRAYGLPGWSMYPVGAAKLTLAAMLVVGIWAPGLVVPAALGMAALMVAAVALHLKINDPFRKAIPAFTMLVLSLLVVAL